VRSLEFSGSDLTRPKLDELGDQAELESLVIWGGGLTNSDLAPLARLRSLRKLVLGELRIDDGVLEYFRGCEQLEALNLAYTDIRGDFSALNGLPLRDVRLEGCRRVGDMAARSLAGFPSLRQLEIHMTGLTDTGIEALAGLPLEILWLGPRVTDAALRTLAQIPTLRHLDICAHNVSDEGAVELARLPNLEILWLTRCGISDSSVEALATMQRVRELNVNDTGVTLSGLNRLKAALPLCRFPEPE